MNPTLALFWKEGREAAYKVVACAGLAFVVGLVCARAEGTPSGGTVVQIMSHLVGLFGAMFMGMDFVARERSRQTLSFMLCRPLAQWKILGSKFAVGVVGLVVVIAAYWGAVFLGVEIEGSSFVQRSFIINPDFTIRTDIPWVETLAEVGYVRVSLLWILVYLVPYGVAALASVLTDHPLKAALTCLMVVWIAWVLFIVGSTAAPPIAKFYFKLVFFLKIMSDAGIVRQAFDTSLILVRAGATAILAGGALLIACRVFRAQASNRIQWIVGGLALFSAIAALGLAVAQSRDRLSHIAPVAQVAPVGQLKFEMSAMGLALKDGLAIVLLDRGISVVDARVVNELDEIGRLEIDGWRLERVALLGTTAYVWGETEDSAGVVVFDLSTPDRPRLQSKSLLYQFEQGPTRWLRRIPRLVGWGAWRGHLYVGLLRNEFLELHSFNVQNGSQPRLTQALTIEKATRHAWNNGWEIRILGPNAFLTLGHDFVVLDLADPGAPRLSSRIPLQRFGRSIHYERMFQMFRHTQPSSDWWSRLAEMDSARSTNGKLNGLIPGIDPFSLYTASAPPALGPITIGNGRAFIERHLPREIAVVDISDPRKPVEIDYIPWTRLPRQFTVEGESAYALTVGAIQTYVMTAYGTFSRRMKLGLSEFEGHPRNFDVFDMKNQGVDPRRDMFIPQGDHIYALLNNHLAIFENPRKAK